MAFFKVVPKPSVEKDLRLLSKPTVARVLKRIEALGNDPFPRESLKLEGSSGLFRIRVGDYRIIYEINRDAKQVIIH